MRITYLHQYYNNTSMKGGTRSYEFARRLVKRGHQVNVITSWRDGGKGNDWFETVDEGINVHWLPINYSNNMSFKVRFFAFLKFAFRSAKKAASIESDIVFATSTPLTIALPSIWAKFRLGVPLVFEVRDLWPELPIAMGALPNPILRWGAKILEKFAYYNSEAVVALSPGMKNGVISCGYPKKRVAVIPNSSDIELFEVDPSVGIEFRGKRPWLDNSPLLLYAGTFGAINGVSYLVDLAFELEKIGSNVKILAIGDGAEYKLVVNQAENLGLLNNNIFFEKGMSKSEIVSAFSAATMASALFIDKPEMRANSANKFFDALAAGKPLLINYGGWMHEIVSKSACGIAAWQSELDQVAAEINHKMNDAKWLSLASESSKGLAHRKFDRDSLSKKIALILESVTSNAILNPEDIAPDDF